MEDEKDKNEEISNPPIEQQSQPSMDEDESHKNNEDTFLSTLQKILPAVGLFGALCYFLGRLYIEEYYYSLGMTPKVLKFGTEDYMFSSFALILLCLIVAIFVYVLSPFVYPIVHRRPKQDNLSILIYSFGGILFASFFIWLIFSDFTKDRVIEIIRTYGAGYLGFAVGVFIALATASILIVFSGAIPRNLSSPTSSRRMLFFQTAIIIIVFLTFLPWITTRMATLEAKADMYEFPRVVLWFDEGELPNSLQKSLSALSESIEVKLITTNNNITYVLKEDNDSTTNWKIYAIPENSIKHIIYVIEPSKTSP